MEEYACNILSEKAKHLVVIKNSCKSMYKKDNKKKIDIARKANKYV